MGREIRRVPPNWKHPTKEYMTGIGYLPMFDKRYETAQAEWLEGLRKWEAGEDPDRETYNNDDGTFRDYWEWNGNPPYRAYYRPWRDEDATWFQLWETVSEGTPVSPPFATLEELAQHLAVSGDDWDQKRGHGGWGIKRARAFCAAGWAPSMMVEGNTVYQSKDIPLVLKKGK